MTPRGKRFVLVYSVAAIITITLLIVVLIVGLLKLSAEPTIEDVYTLIQVITGVLGIPFAVIGAVPSELYKAQVVAMILELSSVALAPTARDTPKLLGHSI